MKTHKSGKPAVVVTVVPTVKTTVFAFKKRKPIAPTGLQKAKFIVAVNEAGGEGDNEFNRFHTAVEVTDAKGNRFEVPKDYNILGTGRGFSSFLNDYNSWSEVELTEDDLYNEFDMDAMIKGKAVVVEIGHRKTGKEWEAFIEAFHPADYTAEAAVEA
jgi:hypothetical protein